MLQQIQPIGGVQLACITSANKRWIASQSTSQWRDWRDGNNVSICTLDSSNPPVEPGMMPIAVLPFRLCPGKCQRFHVEWFGTEINVAIGTMYNGFASITLAAAELDLVDFLDGPFVADFGKRRSGERPCSNLFQRPGK